MTMAPNPMYPLMGGLNPGVQGGLPAAQQGGPSHGFGQGGVQNAPMQTGADAQGQPGVPLSPGGGHLTSPVGQSGWWGGMGGGGYHPWGGFGGMLQNMGHMPSWPGMGQGMQQWQQPQGGGQTNVPGQPMPSNPAYPMMGGGFQQQMQNFQQPMFNMSGQGF